MKSGIFLFFLLGFAVECGHVGAADVNIMTSDDDGSGAGPDTLTSDVLTSPVPVVSSTTEEGKGTDKRALIIGLVVGGVLLLICITLAACWCLRRQPLPFSGPVGPHGPGKGYGPGNHRSGFGRRPPRAPRAPPAPPRAPRINEYPGYNPMGGLGYLPVIPQGPHRMPMGGPRPIMGPGYPQAVGPRIPGMMNGMNGMPGVHGYGGQDDKKIMLEISLKENTARNW